MRDVATLRTVFSANGLIALFDAPWVVVYVAVIWLFHPALGMGAALAALLMLALAWLNDRVSRRALESLQKEGRRASHYVESSLRNAEVLQALGMTQRLLARWRELQDQVAALQTSASRSSVAFTAATRFLRQADPDPDAGARRLPRAHPAGLGRHHDRHHASCSAARCSRWSSWSAAGAC